MENNGDNQQFQYTPQAPTAKPLAQQPESEPTTASQPVTEQAPLMQWKASEFIDHHKSASWFLMLIGGAVLVSGLMYFITRDILSTVVVALAAVALGVFARQKPRTLTYTLLPTSLKIGTQSYSYDDFRTFSIIQDGALYSVLLEPVKRFLPPITIYFAPEDGESIFDTLASHIPHEERQLDPVERLMKKMRF